MIGLKRPRVVLAGAALVVLTNAAMLALAARNRAGTPEARLALTERELALPEVRSREDSGLSLTLTTTADAPPQVRRAAFYRNRRLPPFRFEWLDRGTLQELGYEEHREPLGPETCEHCARAAERPVYVVLELEGEGWRRWLAGREEEVAKARRDAASGAIEAEALADAEALLLLDRTVRSRLVPVDAGLDPAALRARHPDRAACAIVPAIVRVDPQRTEAAGAAAKGRVAELLIPRITVPRAHAAGLLELVGTESWEDLTARARSEAETRWPEAREPRFRATVAFGRRLEPWLIGATHHDSHKVVVELRALQCRRRSMTDQGMGTHQRGPKGLIRLLKLEALAQPPADGARGLVEELGHFAGPQAEPTDREGREQTAKPAVRTGSALTPEATAPQTMGRLEVREDHARRHAQVLLRRHRPAFEGRRARRRGRGGQRQLVIADRAPPGEVADSAVTPSHLGDMSQPPAVDRPG